MKAVIYLIGQYLRSRMSDEEMVATVFWVFFAIVSGVFFGLFGRLLCSRSDVACFVWSLLVNSGPGIAIFLLRLVSTGTETMDMIRPHRPVSGVVRFISAISLQALSNAWLAWIVAGIITLLFIPNYGLLWFSAIPLWIIFYTALELCAKGMFEYKVSRKWWKILLWTGHVLLFWVSLVIVFMCYAVSPSAFQIGLPLISTDLIIPNPFVFLNQQAVIPIFMLANLAIALPLTYWVYKTRDITHKTFVLTHWMPLSVVLNDRKVLKVYLYWILIFKGIFIMQCWFHSYSIDSSQFRFYHFHGLLAFTIFIIYGFFPFMNFMGAFPNIWRHLALSPNAFRFSQRYYFLLLLPFLIPDLLINILIIYFLTDNYTWYLLYFASMPLLLQVGFIFSIRDPFYKKDIWDNWSHMSAEQFIYMIYVILLIVSLSLLNLLPYGWLWMVVFAILATIYLQKSARRLFEEKKSSVFERIVG